MSKMGSLLVVLVACGGSQQLANTAHPPVAPIDAPVATTESRQQPGKELDDTCDRTGDVVFEVNAQENVADGRGTFVRLYRGGALEIEHTNGELPPQSVIHCARHGTLATVSQHVAAAAWKLTPVKSPCKTGTVTPIAYLSGGKLLWTNETCPKDELDAESRKHLAAILAALEPEGGAGSAPDPYAR